MKKQKKPGKKPILPILNSKCELLFSALMEKYSPAAILRTHLLVWPYAQKEWLFFKAISEGSTKFEAIAVIGDTDKPCSPCGACRQVVSEFGEDISLIMVNLKGDAKIKKIKELLPEAFGKNDLL